MDDSLRRELLYCAGVCQTYAEALALWDQAAQRVPLGPYGQRERAEIQSRFNNALAAFDSLDNSRDARAERTTQAEALL